MDFKRLESFCREVQDEIQTLSTEIDASTVASCEEEMFAMLQSTVTSYAVEKRQHRDQLKTQCEALKEEINRKRQLIGEVPLLKSTISGDVMNLESDPTHCIVVPPYKPLLDQFMVELEQLNSKVSERSQRRNKLWSSLCSISDELSLNVPSMPDSLSDADIAAYASQEAELSDMKSRRLHQVKTLAANIDAMRRYLGDTAGPELSNQCTIRLDVQSIEELELRFQETKSIYAERRAQVENLESHITSLTAALEVPAKLPESPTGGGSDDRVAALTQYLEKLNELKLQKLDLFVNNSRGQIERLWDELFLDPTRRKPFETETVSEQLLDEMDAETQRLQSLLRSPERQEAISMLKKYQQIKLNEKKLDEMSHDPGRLARRGFAASLKQEEQLRRFNSKHKPEIIESLSKLDKGWSATHDGETFLVDGKTLSVVLSEERENVPLATKRRLSAGRKRPLSSEQRKVAKIPPSKVRSTLSMPSLNPTHGANNLPLMRASRGKHEPSDRRLASRPQQSLPQSLAAKAAARAMANRAHQTTSFAATRPANRTTTDSTHKPPSSSSRQQPSMPLTAVNPSRINLPSHTPGKPAVNRKPAATRPKMPVPRSMHLPQSEANASAPPSRWESEQLQRMQNLEMSYFYEMSINEIDSSVRQSFDYDRDAF